MLLVSLVLFIFLPAAAVWVGLALIPWRPPTLLITLSSLQATATVVLIFLTSIRWDLGWELPLGVLGPGGLLAALHGLETVLAARDAGKAGAAARRPRVG